MLTWKSVDGILDPEFDASQSTPWLVFLQNCTLVEISAGVGSFAITCAFENQLP